MANENLGVEVSVKFYNDGKGFGFFRQANGPDIFVHHTALAAWGFTKTDMVMDKPATIEIGLAKGRTAAVKIYSIGDKKTPPTETKTIVDRSGDLMIVKVIEITTGRHLFEVRKGGVDGEQIGDDLFCLAKAREMIGKVIVPPVSANHGAKTNVVQLVAKKDKGAKQQKKAA